MSDTTPASSWTTSAHAFSANRSVRAFLFDFAAALFVFALVAGAFSISSGHAFPAPPPAELLTPAFASTAYVPALAVAAPLPPLDAPTSQYTLSLLALAFATLAAFNMAVLRHLHTAYASPRRRS